MEYFNRQVSLVKTDAGSWLTRATATVLIVFVAMLCSCSVMQDRYLFPTMPVVNLAENEGSAIFRGFLGR